MFFIKTKKLVLLSLFSIIGMAHGMGSHDSLSLKDQDSVTQAHVWMYLLEALSGESQDPLEQIFEVAHLNNEQIAQLLEDAKSILNQYFTQIATDFITACAVYQNKPEGHGAPIFFSTMFKGVHPGEFLDKKYSAHLLALYFDEGLRDEHQIRAKLKR